MVQYRFPSGPCAKRRNRRNFFLTTALVATSLSPAFFFAGRPVQKDAPRLASLSSLSGRAPVQDAVAIASTKTYDWALVDPTPALQPETLDFARNAPLAATFRPLSVLREASVEALVPPAQQGPGKSPQSSLAVKTAQSVQVVPPVQVPLPVPRPAEFRAPKPVEASEMVSAPASRVSKSAALPSAPASNPTFFEKLFGVRPASPPASALSYAALESPGRAAPSSRLGPGPNPSAGAATAVYDISAQVVYMPNGERLEAHSGLGDKLDDSRSVHVRMRGATPPGTYDLTEREQLFHGVRALRLNPVGGSAAVYGRDGLLAHTYMLGPNGDSNGCVSFRNYDRFLQAYLKGEVKRLVVMAGRGQDALPRLVNNRTAMPQRSALSARDT
jgi:hypothetical protein